MTLITILVSLFFAYLAIGLIAIIPLLWKGLPAIDPTAKTSTWGFKLLVIPGMVGLWPLLLIRWIKTKKA